MGMIELPYKINCNTNDHQWLHSASICSGITKVGRELESHLKPESQVFFFGFIILWLQ